jgi:hypothetical protein
MDSCRLSRLIKTAGSPLGVLLTHTAPSSSLCRRAAAKVLPQRNLDQRPTETASRVRGEMIRRSRRRWEMTAGSSPATAARAAQSAQDIRGLRPPLEHGDLVTEDQDLGVLCAV